jgi:hypothetical protein
MTPEERAAKLVTGIVGIRIKCEPSGTCSRPGPDAIEVGGDIAIAFAQKIAAAIREAEASAVRRTIEAMSRLLAERHPDAVRLVLAEIGGRFPATGL